MKTLPLIITVIAISVLISLFVYLGSGDSDPKKKVFLDSVKQQVLIQLKKGPQNVNGTAQEFVISEALSDKRVWDLLKDTKYDANCCTYTTVFEHPNKHVVGITFILSEKDKTIVAGYDLQEEKITSVEVMDYIRGGSGVVLFEPPKETYLSKTVDVSKEITQTIVDANNQFALNFYSQASQNDENIFFSPISISTAFAIAYEGARQDTAEEIRTMFGFPEDDAQRRDAFQFLQSDLNENEEYSLSMANALWIKQGYEIRQEYTDTAKTYYGGEINNVDFVTDEGVNTINEWVKSKTQGKIEQLLEPGSTDELTRLVITNAIYFNGEWVHQFSPDWTRQSDFHVSHDKTVKVSMMDLGDRRLNYTQNEILEIIDLPYKGERISMLVLLPKEIDGMKSLEESLAAGKLPQWKKSLSETQIAVFLPKFAAETKYNLKNNLQDMGMTAPFDMYGADFSGINEREQLYIDEAVHKAFVGVNELGTEAAAATGIEVRATSGPPATFRADHPFIFLIQDNETGLILFMGKIVNPTK